MITGTTAAKLVSSGLAIPLLLLTFSSCSAADDESSDSVGHPKLILTKAGVEKIRSELGNVPLFRRDPGTRPS